jgi:predicted ATP-dependent protease
VNQLGEVQAIGAVNEKIEGFFDICAARGLTGAEGVIIPAANVEHLMLDERVVAAAADGRFGIHAVRHVDEAIALLTGVPAGEPEFTTAGPQHTVNGRVSARLKELAALRREEAPRGPARPRPGRRAANARK